MTRLRELRIRLLCRWRGCRGPYLSEYVDGMGGRCVRCDGSLFVDLSTIGGASGIQPESEGNDP